MSESEKTQFTTVDGTEALVDPVFIIERNGVYYLTLAVWEYNPANVFDDRTEADVQKIADIFAQEVAVGETFTAVIPKDDSVHTRCATRPACPP